MRDSVQAQRTMTNSRAPATSSEHQRSPLFYEYDSHVLRYPFLKRGPTADSRIQTKLIGTFTRVTPRASTTSARLSSLKQRLEPETPCRNLTDMTLRRPQPAMCHRDCRTCRKIKVAAGILASGEPLKLQRREVPHLAPLGFSSKAVPKYAPYTLAVPYRFPFPAKAQPTHRIRPVLIVVLESV